MLIEIGYYSKSRSFEWGLSVLLIQKHLNDFRCFISFLLRDLLLWNINFTLEAALSIPRKKKKTSSDRNINEENLYKTLLSIPRNVRKGILDNDKSFEEVR